MVFSGSTAADTTAAVSVLGQRSVGRAWCTTASSPASVAPAAGQRVTSASFSTQVASASTRALRATVRDR